MTGYFRHIQSVFKEAGVTVIKESRKEIDQAIHRIVGVRYKNCSLTWRRLKERIKDEDGRKAFSLESKRVSEQS